VLVGVGGADVLVLLVGVGVAVVLVLVSPVRGGLLLPCALSSLFV
jgi:hypothetical protein